jgi:hypothetical protein
MRIVNPSLGRTRAFDGCPRMVTQGLRGAGERSAMLWAKRSELSLSGFAQKACDLPSLANPARRIRLALFRTFRTLSNAIHLGAQWNDLGG